MDIDLAEYRKQFFVESKELLETAGENILKVEAEPENEELINSLFRAIHTIKGSAGSFGLSKISEFAHYLENLLGLIRDKKLTIHSDIIDTILDATDYITELIRLSEAEEDYEIEQSQIDRIKAHAGDIKTLQESQAKTGKKKSVIAKQDLYIAEGVLEDLQKKYTQGLNAYKIVLHYSDSELANGYDPAVFLKNLYDLCQEYICLTENTVPPIGDFQPQKLYLQSTVYILTLETEDTIYDLLLDEDLIEIFNFTETFADDRQSPPPQIENPVLDDMEPQVLKEFLNGVEDIYQYLQPALLEYERSKSTDELAKIYRYIHTLKGDASYLGLEEIVLLSHELESFLDRLKKSEQQVTDAQVEKIFINIDTIFDKIKLINHSINRETVISGSFYKTSNASRENTNQIDSLDPLLKDAFYEHIEQIFGVLSARLGQIEIKENHKIIIRLLKNIQSSSKYVSLSSLHYLVTDTISELEKEDYSLEICAEKIKEVLLFLQGLLGESKKLGQILIEEGIISEEDLAETLKLQKPIGELLIESGKVNQEQVEKALQKQKILDSARNIKQSSGSSSGPTDKNTTMKVDETKVESFSNMIGELIVARNTYDFCVNELLANIGQESNAEIVKSLKENLHVISRITNEMQNGVMSLRMLPVKLVFQKYYRVVRDISRKQKKEIELVLFGENVEVDKKIADSLSEPMVHLIRNACDHGIENPEERKKAGKPEKGKITLKAHYEGNNIVIQIMDDGKGLSKERILTKAQNMGYPTDNLSDEEIYNLIFLPGLSTAQEVTDVSGRGVGMDVVMSTVKSLSGKIRVYSAPGEGSRIDISFPVSMGVSQVLIVESDGSNFALPLDNVLEAMKITKEDIHVIHGKMAFYFRGDVLNMERMENVLIGKECFYTDFQVETMFQQHEEVAVVILQSMKGKFAILVDRLKKNMEIAIKPVPKQLAHIQIISGVTIMGDGSIVQVINVEEIQ